MKGIKYILLLLLPALGITACKDDDSIIENPSGETLIYNLYIANGGLSGVYVITQSITMQPVHLHLMT